MANVIYRFTAVEIMPDMFASVAFAFVCSTQDFSSCCKWSLDFGILMHVKF